MRALIMTYKPHIVDMGANIIILHFIHMTVSIRMETFGRSTSSILKQLTNPSCNSVLGDMYSSKRSMC